MKIQDDIRAQRIQLVWSYILDLENDNNPYDERRRQISEWKIYSVSDVQENAEIVNKANDLTNIGLSKLDAFHIACAIFSQCEYFLTTNDKVLRNDSLVQELKIVDPFLFIKENE
ncbi:MAG: hypothetical protein JKP90_01300 [Desulfofustis sp. PB-SRB1]|jgi:predicted nucleic acid-binding protein|nr:hypothetical protein [Desulfofustis sp. PB-SRB1]